jgi:hypothetical protein
MADRLDDVRAAIEHPDFIAQDVRYHHRETYYRRVASGQGLLKVVVQYRPVPPLRTWAGEVITAYRVKKRKSREVLLEP